MEQLPQVLLVTISGIMGLLFLYGIWRCMSLEKKKKNRLHVAPEAAGAWPFLGHLPLLLLKIKSQTPIFHTLGAMAEKHGPVFTIRLGLHRALVVSSPEAVKECFTTNDKAFASRPTSGAGKILGYDYSVLGFAPYGSLWRDMRKLFMVKILSTRPLHALKHVRTSELGLFTKDLYSLGGGDNWVNSGAVVKVEMCRWFQRLSFNIVLQMIAGKRYYDNSWGGDKEARRAIAAIHELLSLSGTFVLSDAIPFVEWMDFQGHLASMKRVAKEIDDLVGGWVEEHQREIKVDGGGRRWQDFIDIMLSASEDFSVFGHSRETVIKAAVTTLMVGGSDTISTTCTWILSALLNNKHALERVKEELDLKVGKERWVEESDIPNLVYLYVVLKETLRLYTIVPLLVPHEATEDCQVAGYHVPKGTRLMVNAWKLHRDPNIFFEPNDFKPERFLTTHVGVDVLGQNFELIPFGSGRRSCPGTAMALQLVPLIIARLLQGFDVSTPLDAPVDMRAGLSVTLVKLTPLEVILTPRLPSHLYHN